MTASPPGTYAVNCHTTAATVLADAHTSGVKEPSISCKESRDHSTRSCLPGDVLARRRACQLNMGLTKKPSRILSSADLDPVTAFLSVCIDSIDTTFRTIFLCLLPASLAGLPSLVAGIHCSRLASD